MWRTAVTIAASLAGLEARDIVWISQVDSPAGAEFLVLLRGQGYGVTERLLTSATLSAEAIEELNGADLVVFSRKTTSGAYNTAVWDQIRAPMIVLSPYVLRASRWAWTTTELVPGETPATLTLLDPAHPLFAGVPADPSGLTKGWHLPVGRGTSFLAPGRWLAAPPSPPPMPARTDF